MNLYDRQEELCPKVIREKDSTGLKPVVILLTVEEGYSHLFSFDKVDSGLWRNKAIVLCLYDALLQTPLGHPQ